MLILRYETLAAFLQSPRVMMHKISVQHAVHSKLSSSSTLPTSCSTHNHDFVFTCEIALTQRFATLKLVLQSTSSLDLIETVMVLVVAFYFIF